MGQIVFLQPCEPIQQEFSEESTIKYSAGPVGCSSLNVTWFCLLLLNPSYALFPLDPFGIFYLLSLINNNVFSITKKPTLNFMLQPFWPFRFSFQTVHKPKAYRNSLQTLHFISYITCISIQTLQSSISTQRIQLTNSYNKNVQIYKYSLLLALHLCINSEILYLYKTEITLTSKSASILVLGFFFWYETMVDLGGSLGEGEGDCRRVARVDTPLHNHWATSQILVS